MSQTKFHIQNGKITGIQQTQKETTKKIIIIQTKKSTPRKYKPKKCKWCNTQYTPTNPHQLYCDKTCSTLAKQKYGRSRVQKFRKKYKDVLHQIKKYTNIGTGGLGQHMAASFEEEQEKIQDELQALKLIKIRNKYD